MITKCAKKFLPNRSIHLYPPSVAGQDNNHNNTEGIQCAKFNNIRFGMEMNVSHKTVGTGEESPSEPLPRPLGYGTAWPPGRKHHGRC